VNKSDYVETAYPVICNVKQKERMLDNLQDSTGSCSILQYRIFWPVIWFLG